MKGATTPSEYADWKRDAITKLLMEDLDGKCKMLMNMWSRAGFTVKGNPQASTELNAGALGSIEQLNNILDAIEHGSFLMVNEEKENV